MSRGSRSACLAAINTSSSDRIRLDMHSAFETWNIGTEELESVENRIHDGAPHARLKDRARGYIDTFARLFPWSLPQPGARLMEIGGGLAYVMHASAERLAPGSVVGLDVAPSMIEKAKQRLSRDRA